MKGTGNSVGAVVWFATIAAIAASAMLARNGHPRRAEPRARAPVEVACVSRTAALCRRLVPAARDWEASVDATSGGEPGRAHELVAVWCVSPASGATLCAYWDLDTRQLLQAAATLPAAAPGGGTNRTDRAVLAASRGWRDRVAQCIGDLGAPRLAEQYAASAGNVWTRWETARYAVCVLVRRRDGALVCAMVQPIPRRWPAPPPSP